MPNFSLIRNVSDFNLSDITAGVEKVISEGSISFGELRSSVSNSSSTRTDVSIPNGTESLFQAHPPAVFFKALGGTEKLLEDIAQVEITESIDGLYREGVLTIVDYRGFVELTGITNTREGEYVRIELKNKFEQKFKSIKFGLFDMVDEPWNNVTKYKLIEEPYFNSYYKKVVNRGFTNVRATQLIANILANDVGIERLKMVENTQGDPKFPSFIFPNWNAAKCIKYLSQYSEQGPIKVFNVTMETDTVTIVAPLEKLMTGQVFPTEQDIFPSASEKVAEGFRLNKWTLFGVNSRDVKNSLSGETVMTFNHLAGQGDREDFATFGVDSYDFEQPDDKNYSNIVGGEYKDGVKRFTNNLGGGLVYKREDKSNKEHLFKMDVEEKPLVSAKIKSRFLANYYDEFMLRVVIAPSSVVNVGQIFNIILPSEYQPDELSNREYAELSGKWLLTRVEHKITPVDSRLKYELVCYFYRTGFTVPNPTRNIDRV